METANISRKYIYEQKIVDMDEFIRTTMTGWANCQSDSLILWSKLRKAGAQRCYGSRISDRKISPKAKHYWVELKDKVYDEHGGHRQIIQRSAYYKTMEIECDGKCDHIGLLEHEMPLEMLEWDMRARAVWAERMGMEAWAKLAQKLREKNDY